MISGSIRDLYPHRADFFSVLIFCDCVKRSVASSMVLCTTETIQMGSSQQLEST